MSLQYSKISYTNTYNSFVDGKGNALIKLDLTSSIALVICFLLTGDNFASFSCKFLDNSSLSALTPLSSATLAF